MMSHLRHMHPTSWQVTIYVIAKKNLLQLSNVLFALQFLCFNVKMRFSFLSRTAVDYLSLSNNYVLMDRGTFSGFFNRINCIQILFYYFWLQQISFVDVIFLCQITLCKMHYFEVLQQDCSIFFISAFCYNNYTFISKAFILK